MLFIQASKGREEKEKGQTKMQNLLLQILMGHFFFVMGQVHQYEFIDTTKSWEEAQKYCRSNYTDLATVPNVKFMKKLQNTINGTAGGEAWIGLYNKPQPTQTWRWSQPEMEMDAVPWATDEPNNKEGPDNTILQKDEKSWDEAFRYCRKKHSDLVSIVSLEDQSWIQEKVKNASTEYVWLGLQYSCSLDLWFWLNDMISEEDLFEEGRPECDTVVAMSKEGKYKMVRKSENKKYNFICSLNYSDTGQGLSFYGLQCAKDDEDAALKYP
uniref:C-type lectin domain-containing protein n=1 Tax=Salarias fasciatus TaxID=181472 RepID=A0A672IZ19_SALFA